MRTAHASETTMKGEQGRGALLKVFGEVSKTGHCLLSLPLIKTGKGDAT